MAVAIMTVLVSAALILLARDYSHDLGIRHGTPFAMLLIVCQVCVTLPRAFRIRHRRSRGSLSLLGTVPHTANWSVSCSLPSIPTGLNWQVQNSLKGITSRRVLRERIGNGIFKLVAIIPEVQNDFIFASLGGETGFIGVSLFLPLVHRIRDP